MDTDIEGFVLAKYLEIILLIFFVLSLLLSSYLIGNFFSTLIILLVAIAIISVIYGLADIKSFDEDMITRVRHSAYSLSYSILLSLIPAILLPYLLFHSFLNIYVIQYAYVLPVLIVFFCSVYFFDNYTSQKEFSSSRMFKYGIIISVCLSVFITAGIMILTNTYYHDKTASFYTDQDKILLQLQDNSQKLPIDTYPIYDDINGYRADFLARSLAERNSFAVFDNSHRFCSTDDCTRMVTATSYDVIEMTVDSASISLSTNQAIKESGYIENNGFQTISDYFNYSFFSLDEYSGFLKAVIDSANYSLYRPTEQVYDTRLMMESDFSYPDYERIEKYFIQDGAGSEVLFHVPLDHKSIFYRSFDYTIKHTIYYQEAVRLMIKSYIFLDMQKHNTDLFAKIYDNMNVTEPLTSKTIRYRIIVNRLMK